MSKNNNDINDDEIRVITPSTDDADNKPKRRLPLLIITVICLLILIIAGIRLISGSNEESGVEPGNEEPVSSIVEDKTARPDTPVFTAISDTVVGSIPLSIFEPVGAMPTLHIGSDILHDSTAVLVVQAADIRRDNGMIVGAFVDRGQLVSRGQSKSGFCAIIGGKAIVGVADATPYLEQAIESEGYFFRQYPLVVANQVIENKLKNSALRKALVELNGRIMVVAGNRKQTLTDFAQTLADLGVSNAIYLVGSNSNGFAVDADGKRTFFGLDTYDIESNANYIVWR